MAAPNSTRHSHIVPNSTASLFRTTEDIRKEFKEKTPPLLHKYKSSQWDSCFARLPEELELSILSACAPNARAEVLLNFGLTCHYWHLRVRDYIEFHSDGQAFRRAHEQRQFSNVTGNPPAKRAMEAIRSCCGRLTGNHSRKNITDSTEAISKIQNMENVFFVPVDSSDEWEDKFSEIFPRRAGCLAIFDARLKRPPAHVLIEAMKDISRGSYAALVLPPEGMTTKGALALARKMKEHPVVCLVAAWGENPSRTIHPTSIDLSLFKACAETKVEGTSFRFEYGHLDETQARQLADAICDLKTDMAIEITALKTTQESMSLIFQAVLSVNQSSAPKVNLTCDGSEICQVVGNIDSIRKMNASDLSRKGIHFVNMFSIDKESTESDDSTEYESDSSVHSDFSEEASFETYEPEAEAP